MIKRILSVLLAVLLAFPAVFAFAEPETIDLSAMTMEELRAMQERVYLAMFTSKDWQAVQVPAGAYLIGDLIPAGRWTFVPLDGTYASVAIADSINATMTDRAQDGKYIEYFIISSETSFMYEEFPMPLYTLYLPEGMYLVIKDSAVLLTSELPATLVFK